MTCAWCAWASWQRATTTRSQAPELAAANEVLKAFHAGGEAELRALAAQAGTTSMEMLCAAKLSANLLRARRGAAADLLHNAAQRLACANVPAQIAAGLRLGRMVALQKPAGGIQALVMGDVFRRLVSRTLAQQLGAQLQEACAPFQYALTTRAGTEALARALRFATESHQSTTVVSVDGVGAYDHISRSCMFQGLRDCPALAPLSPLVRYVTCLASMSCA